MESIKLLAESIIFIAAVITATLGIVAFIRKLFTPFDEIAALKSDNEQKDKEIAELQAKIIEKEQSILDRHDRDIKSIQKENQILTYGVLACLKGLQEKGCDGAVTKAVNELEKYLNEAAHEII